MPSFMIEYEHLKIQLKDIKLATNDFDEKNVIGHGGFGKVYKGELCHSHSERKSLVALKRLDRKHGQGDPQFWKEIMMLSRYRHENLISLLGFCNEEGEMILVYEYAPGGSLERYLKDANLTWTERIKICLDASRGLRFLHEPNERNQRVLHCDIKSANILLDENMNAKVSDFGLSKMGSTYQHYSLIVTNAVGTVGYCDPLYMETYQLTKESDVYSFGVVLFEVLCGRQCAESINGQLKVFVPFWKQCYEDKKLEGIVLEDIKQQMNLSSLDIFAGIAYQCLHKDREQRPAMSRVVEKLESALQMQMLPKEFVEIANAAVDPLLFRSLEEFKELLSKGVLLNGGKTWLSVNDKGEHHIMNSIEDYLSFNEPITDNPNTNYRARYSVEKKSRFAIGCYETELMEFKLHITTPLFLSPDITYRINLVFHYSEIENMKQHVGVMYKLQGETTISIVHFADKKEDKQLVAELYEFTSNEESILDLEIVLEDCGLSGQFYIEGIEFRPMEKVEHQVVVANKEIDADAAPPMLYRFTEESKALVPQGALIKNGTWLSMNNKGELCVLISIKNCLIGDYNYKFYGHDYSFEKDSRFADGCYKTDKMNFRIRVKTPLCLSPCVRYRLNLVFKHDNTEALQQQSFPVWYSLKGETKGEIMMSIVHLNDNRKDGWLVAELYQFTSDGESSILDLEFRFDSCGLWGNMFIEGVEFQPLGRVEQVVVAEYEEILKGVTTPLYYRSVEELKVLLSKGILLERRMWLSINEKGQHIERIYIQACLNPDKLGADSWQHLSYDIVSSRFPGGLLYVYKNEYKARAIAKYLSLQVSYTVNLVFRYKNQSDVNLYNHLRYKLCGEDETKVFTIYQTTPMREDGWFIAPLHHFTSQSQNTTADLQFEFEDRHTQLLIAGIEFQPLEENVEQVFEEYKNIVKASSQSLFYTSLDELKQILSNGVHLNEYKLWFSLNEKGEHCEMISMEDCLIPNAYFPSQYKSHWCSRFPAGLYQTNNKGFRTHVKTQLLSPKITYTVNLVIHGSSSDKQEYVGLEYTLRGEITSTVYLAKRIDDYFYMAELYQFTSDGGIVDLEIDFDNPGTNIEFVEGILFQPLDIVEDPVLEDDKVEDIQTISHSGILNLSNSTEKKTSKKNLCSPLRKWFQFNNDTAKEWSYLDKSGKKCFILSARAACSRMKSHFTWRTLPESRFEEVLVITAGREFKLVSEINPTLLSPDTTYVCYFVYKLPQQQYTFEPPLKVSNGSGEDYDQYIYSYLVSPPNTPVIGQKFDENNYNPLNRYNLSALPRQRSDGWMEVKVWDFQTKKTPKTVWMNLKLEHPVKKDLSGLIVHGIEIR